MTALRLFLRTALLRRLVLPAAVILFSLTCFAESRAQESAPNPAWNYLKTLTGFGPRYPGSPGHARTIAFLKQVGEQYADSVREQAFTHDRSGAEPLALSNVIFTFVGTRKGPPVLIGTHHDTRPFADEDPNPALRSRPILGANDGGSGTAVLLALAEHLSAHRPERTVQLVFFDGEDLGAKGSGENLLGSIHYADRLRDTDEKPYCVLIIDMIGDRDLEIYRESFSVKNAAWLVDLIFKVARKKNLPQFKDKLKYTIYDDHYPFIGLGIPSVVLIDFDYPHWHKMTDTLDKCSPESLALVFDVVVEVLKKL